jgi:hypothetical protein
MKKHVRYSCQYNVYYSYGSVFGSGLSNESLPKLETSMGEIVDAYSHKEEVELITFTPIQRTETLNIEVKGRMMQFVPRVTNSYAQGDKEEFFKKID